VVFSHNSAIRTRTTSISLPLGGEEEKDTKIFQLFTAWEPPRLDVKINT